MRYHKIKNYIKLRLEEHSNLTAYHKEAPIEIAPPFIVFTITLINYSYNNYTYVLELNIWDDTNDSSTITAEADLIEAGLNKSWQSENECFFSIYIEFNSNIPDQTPDKSRINQRYKIELKAV